MIAVVIFSLFSLSHFNIWTQSEVTFCENEGSNRFKINEKGDQLDRKTRRKLIQNAYNMLNNTF